MRILADLFNSLKPTRAPVGTADREHTLQLVTAVLLIEVVRADGQIDDSERQAVLQALQSRFPLTGQELAELFELARHKSEHAHDLHSFTALINEQLGEPERIHVFELLWAVAYANGKADDHEAHLLRRLGGSAAHTASGCDWRKAARRAQLIGAGARTRRMARARAGGAEFPHVPDHRHLLAGRRLAADRRDGAAAAAAGGGARARLCAARQQCGARAAAAGAHPVELHPVGDAGRSHRLGLGGRFAYLLPDRWFAAVIGLFVLVTTWLPQPRVIATSRAVQFLGGMVVSALGMVVGAAGPLVAAFVRGIPDRRQLVATHAMLNTFVHVFKVAVFVALGFAFRQYLPLILLMVVAGFAGTAVGSRLLTRVPENVFRLGFRVLLSLVALELIRRAL